MQSVFLSVLLSLTFLMTGTTVAETADQSSRYAPAGFSEQLSAEAEHALISFQDSLQRITAGSNAKITDVAVDQSMSSDGDFATLDTSCTASATVGIPGGSEVTIEATAPTCTEAVQMVQDAVEDLLDDLDPE